MDSTGLQGERSGPSEMGARPPEEAAIAMCQNRRLAHAGPFGVDYCAACDSLQVHVGPLTLRLDPLAVRELESVLTEALAELDREPEPLPSPRPLAN